MFKSWFSIEKKFILKINYMDLLAIRKSFEKP